MKALKNLKEMPNAEFVFKTVIKDPVSINEKGDETQNYRFILETELEVRGISPIYNPDDRMATPKYDQVFTTEIRVNGDLLESIPESEFDLTNEDDIRDGGTYKGKCYLDISASGEVWLTKTRLSDFGKTSRMDRGRERWRRIN